MQSLENQQPSFYGKKKVFLPLAMIFIQGVVFLCVVILYYFVNQYLEPDLGLLPIVFLPVAFFAIVGILGIVISLRLLIRTSYQRIASMMLLFTSLFMTSLYLPLISARYLSELFLSSDKRQTVQSERRRSLGFDKQRMEAYQNLTKLFFNPQKIKEAKNTLIFLENNEVIDVGRMEGLDFYEYSYFAEYVRTLKGKEVTVVIPEYFLGYYTGARDESFMYIENRQYGDIPGEIFVEGKSIIEAFHAASQ